MSDAYAVQVNQDLFAYKKTPSFVCYSNLTGGPIRKTVKATPPSKRSNPFITNFADKFIFVGGGYFGSQYHKTVDMFIISTNLWISAP